MELQVAGVRQGYRKTEQSPDTNQLTDAIKQRFALREHQDVQRLQQMCDWLQSAGCLQQGILDYFGEQMPQPCGQCSACKVGAAQLPARETQALDQTVVMQAMQEHSPALAQPRQLARFLCGLTSPQSSRARLSKHRLFGALAQTPFSEVLEACREALGIAARRLG